MNKNTILAAKRISDKYRNIRRKRKRVKNPDPIVDDKKDKKHPLLCRPNQPELPLKK